MTISSGVTRRNSASALRVFSLAAESRLRFCWEGSRSTICVSRVRTSTTGADAGQRLAAFITARSGGITNCARTLFQNASPAAAPPVASGGRGDDCAHAGCVNNAAEPPTANKRAKSRRDVVAAMGILRAEVYAQKRL